MWVKKQLLPSLNESGNDYYNNNVSLKTNVLKFKCCLTVTFFSLKWEVFIKVLVY